MNEEQKKEVEAIVKRLEEIGEMMHPHEARHIDTAVIELEYYLID